MRTILTFLIALLVANTTVYGFTGSCSGTYVDPYLIASASQLNEASNDLAAHCEQIRDITLRIVCQYHTCSGVVVVTVSSLSCDIEGYKLSITRN